MRRFHQTLLFIAIAGSASSISHAQTCTADITRECGVTIEDFLLYLDLFDAGDIRADIDDGRRTCTPDGGVTIEDFLLFLELFDRGAYARPDLVGNIVSVSPTIITPGCPMDIQVRVSNVGQGHACGTFVAGAMLSIGPDIGGGDDTPWDERLIVLNEPLGPGESRIVRLSDITFNAPLFLGTQHLYVCLDRSNTIHETNEGNNCDTRTVSVQCDDVAVTGIVAVDSLVSGRPARVDVTLQSFTSCVRDVPVQLALCGQNLLFANARLPGLTTQTYRATIIPPPTPWDCGAPTACTLSASINLPCDRDRTNDYRAVPVAVADPYYDLRVSIVGAPSTGNRNSSITWRVRVTNTGNADSPNGVRILSGINCAETCFVWNCNLGIIDRQIGSLAPGASTEYSIGNYGIPPHAYCGTQYIKAEICGTCGTPTDNCGAGNCDTHSIRITGPGCN